MKKVQLKLEGRAYDIKIGAGGIDALGRALRMAKSKRAFIIADRNLVSHRKKVIGALKRAGWHVDEVAVTAGESLKELKALYPIYGEMIKAGVDRSSTLIAVGGGSVGDAAGFVASTYMRGIPWVGVPTTLLAQVDSAIGGKTAVNHPLGKNLIGTFHQPSLVVCDTNFLKTLSDREVISGLGEVIKYGLVYDRRLFRYIEKNWTAALKLRPTVLEKLVQQSARWKSRAIEKDEFDRHGVREVLNFGHTFAHALESVTKYRIFQHGEAVIWGMRFATALSLVTGRLAAKTYDEVDGFLGSIPLPPLPKKIKAEAYFDVMKKDKKAQNGRVRFVLLSDFEKTVLDRQITEVQLRQAFLKLGTK